MTTFNSCAGLESTKPPEDDNNNNNNNNNSKLFKIKKLKAKLINEEHRLVLMKKIRQSQTRPIAPQTNSNQQGALNSNNSNSNSQSSQVKKLRSTQTGAISLQKNHSTGLMGIHGSSPAPSSSSLAAPPTSSSSSSSMNQTPAHAHQRPKVNTLWNPPQQARHPTPAGIAPPHVGNLSRQPITTPPNVVQAMMGNLASQQSLLLNQINAAAAAAAATTTTGSHRTSQQQSSSSSFNRSTQPTQMLLQKKPIFKPSIQKQLEQTLLQQTLQQSQKHGQTNLGFSPNLSKRNSSSSSSSSSLGITSPHVGNLSRQPITTPPNVVQDMRAGLSSQRSLLMNASNLSSISSSRKPQQQQQTQQSSFNKSQAAQILLQKRTAAKTAIQKQLEQTLTQLPQKHIQIGIDFVPNANNIEFVYYVGLEACVDYLTGTKNPLDTQPLEKPFECSTCGTDYTPAWSWKRSNAVCENCVSEHVKKSIKNSQTSRIKSVLSKAVKQEQDMEQRIMAEAANVVSTASPVSSSSQQHSLLQPASHHHHQQPQQRSTPQLWPRINPSPLNVANTNRSTNVQPPPPAVNPNPLAGVQPAALASLLQMNPQLSTLASIMTANNNSNNTNQFAQVAALLMNQLTKNLWKR